MLANPQRSAAGIVQRVFAGGGDLLIKPAHSGTSSPGLCLSGTPQAQSLVDPNRAVPWPAS